MNQEQIDEKIKEEVKACVRTENNAARLAQSLPRLLAVILPLPSLRFCYCYPGDAKIICGVKLRDDLKAIRALHQGKWEKSEANGYDKAENLEYRACVEGIELSVRVTELPPSCKVIEEQVLVPAQEAKIRIVRKVICTDPTKEHADAPEVLPATEAELAPV